MTTSVKSIGEDIGRIKEDLKLIKNILLEDYELSEETKEKLLKARNTPDSEYMSHDEVKKRILGA